MFSKIKEAELFPDEILALLEHKTNAGNKNWYPKMRGNIITAAYEKMEAIENTSQLLFRKASAEHPDILANVKEIFGNDDGFGKYVKSRVKDVTSISGRFYQSLRRKGRNTLNDFYERTAYCQYERANKEYQEWILEQFKGQKLDLTKKDYENFLSRINAPIEDFASAIIDLHGFRLVLPKGNEAECTQAAEYLTKAIENKKLNMTFLQNFHIKDSEGIFQTPYIDDKTIDKWQRLKPDLEVGPDEKFNQNGYTTFQSRCLSNKGSPFEIQIRSENMNDVASTEELIYATKSFLSKRSKKDISYGIPELMNYYKSSGFIDNVQNLLDDYILDYVYTFEYIKSHFVNARLKDFGVIRNNPNVSTYANSPEMAKKLEPLSFQNLKHIKDKTLEIKAKYGK